VLTFFAGARLLAVVVFLVVVAVFALGLPATAFLTTGFFAVEGFALLVVVFFGAGAFALVVVLGFAVVVLAFAALGLAVVALGLAEALEAGLFCTIIIKQMRRIKLARTIPLSTRCRQP